MALIDVLLNQGSNYIICLAFSSNNFIFHEASGTFCMNHFMFLYVAMLLQDIKYICKQSKNQYPKGKGFTAD